MEQRKRRRKKCRSGETMAVDSRELGNSEKSSTDVTQLAHKYMQKCRVESSTDSESDANPEVLLNSTFPGGLLKKTAYKKLQFLDPYDGDYEEASGTSDTSLDSLADACPRKGIFMKHPIPEDQSVEENFAPEHQVSVFTAPYWGVSAAVTHETNYPKPKDNLILTEMAAEKYGNCWRSRFPREAEPCDTVLQQTTEPSLFIQHNSSEYSRFSENVGLASVSRLAMRLSDKRAREDPIIKRKPGQPVLECAGENLRKKLRAT